MKQQSLVIMKRTAYLTVFISLFLLMAGAVSAQTSQDFEVSGESQDAESQLGEAVQSYNFVIRGLPAEADIEGPSNSGEVDAEREFENEPDENTNFSLSEEKALEAARESLGSDEWDLEDSSRDDEDGVYEFEFTAGESEAETEVDGSSGEVISLEGEVEYEPEEQERREDSTLSLSGFVVFDSDNYEVEVESEDREDSVDFTVVIEGENESDSEGETRAPVEETEEVGPGTYNVNLEVVRDGETVLQRSDEVTVPESETEEAEESDEVREDPEDMTREQLIEEVKSLREQIRELQEDTQSNGEQGPPSDVPAEPSEDEETEEEESDESEDSGRPTEAPGEGSSNRPGFVNDLLNGLFS